MKRYLVLLFFLCIVLSANASQSDTSAYQLQRLKVNALLSQRSAKFGQYDKSLDSKSGIFGLQTKGDIKKSNEILRQIVLNDNNIFKELKILLDYKDQEIRRVQAEASSSNSRIENYMHTIKKLQDQNDLLKKKTGGLNLGALSYVVLLLMFFFAGLSFFLYKKFKRASTGPF